MNSKRGIKNVTFGILYQLLVFAFGLITPRLLIKEFGDEVNGLLSSVHQIYTYVALLEAGIGTASLQALYKTIAAEDRKGTSGVLSATHYFYRRTGILYFLAVIVLSVLYPILIDSDIDLSVVVAVILLNGIPGVINYLFQGKYRILLQAEGKSYLLSNLSSITYVLSNLAKIALIYFGFGVIHVQVAYFLINLLPLGFIAFHIVRHYKWLDLKERPDFAAISQRKSVIVHQLSGMVFSSTDVIILSVFTNLDTVSIYTVISGLYGTVKSVLFSFLDGLKFSMGQMFHKDKDQYLKLHDVFELYYMALTFAMYTVLQLFMVPFLTLYMDGVTDVNYADPLLVILFTLIYLLQGARGPASLAIDFAQHFKQTRGRAVLEMAINLTVSIVGVILLGAYGALLCTIAALLYRTNDIILYASKVILKRSPWATYRRWLVFIVLFVLFFALGSLLPASFTSYLSFILYAVPSALIVLCVYLGLASLMEPKVFRDLLAFFRGKK